MAPYDLKTFLLHKWHWKVSKFWQYLLELSLLSIIPYSIRTISLGKILNPSMDSWILFLHLKGITSIIFQVKFSTVSEKIIEFSFGCLCVSIYLMKSFCFKLEFSRTMYWRFVLICSFGVWQLLIKILDLSIFF